MSVRQHFLKIAISVIELQKNLEKQRNVIVCCHERCLCKICIEMQFPVRGAPMVQIYSVLVLLILDPLRRNCRGDPKRQINHTLRTVSSETWKKVFFAFCFF